MNSVEMLLENSFFQTLGWTLLHFIWQGALVVILLANLNIMLRRRTANLRYTLSCAAMLLMLALPVATFVVASQTLPVTSIVEKASARTDVSGGAQDGAAATAPFETAYVPTESSSAAFSLLPTVFQSGELARRLNVWLPWMVAIWLSGVLLLSLRMVGGWAMAQRLKRRQTNPASDEWQSVLQDLCARLRVSRPVRLCQSLLIEVPTVIGWLKPVILVPVRALTGLTPQQLEALLAHELAHIRRHDYLVNLLQTIIETLLFYHPAVWWVSHQVRVERENCCDDMAVAACGDVFVYAHALAELEQLRMGSDAPALTMAASGTSLVRRIGRLVKLPAPASHRSSPWLAGFIAIATILCMWVTARTDASAKVDAVADAYVSALPSSHELTASSVDVQTGRATNEHRLEVKEKIIEGATREERHDAAQEIHSEAESIEPSVVNVETPILAAQEPQAESSGAEQAQEGSAASGGGDYIDELAAEGYTKLSVDQIITLKIHGVDRNFIRQMKSLGFSNLSVDKLAALKIHGVSAATIEMMKSAGFDNLSPEQLIAVRIHGLTPAFVQEMKSHLRGSLSLEKLLALKIHGVDGDYIESLKAAGFENLTADQIAGARIHGVTPAFARAMKEAGYANLSLDKLVALRIFGVTPEFVRAVKSRGFDDLTVEQLIELKRLGIIKNPGNGKAGDARPTPGN